MTNDELFMRRAVELAKAAYEDGEIAVGAVIVKDGAIIAEAANSREGERDALAHAEIGAISAACGAIGDWRLSDCTMYVTLEPCPMCAGAILMSRIGRLVFGAYSPEGAVISKIRLFDSYDSGIKITGGMLLDECRELIQLKKR